MIDLAFYLPNVILCGAGFTMSNIYSFPIFFLQLTGLTKRTTCDDVIYALLCHDTASAQCDVSSFSIYEQWRGVERPLKGRTKITKIWRAWAIESRNVKLVLRANECTMDTSSEASRSWRPRKRPTREKNARSRAADRETSAAGTRQEARYNRGGYLASSESHEGEPRRDAKERHGHASSARQQQANPNKGTANSTHWQQYNRTADYVKKLSAVKNRTASVDIVNELLSANSLHKLVTVILDQERHITEQIDELDHADSQIRSYEKKVSESQRSNVEQTAAMEDGAISLFPNVKANDTEAYLHICDSILELQDRIDRERHRIDELNVSVTDETQLAGRTEDETTSRSAVTTTDHSARIQQEVESIRDDIERSVMLSIAQQKQLRLVSKTLDDCERQLRRKRQYIETLASRVDGELETGKVKSPCPPESKDPEPSSSSGIDSGLENSPEPDDVRKVCCQSDAPSAQLASSMTRNHVWISETMKYCRVEIDAAETVASSGDHGAKRLSPSSSSPNGPHAVVGSSSERSSVLSDVTGRVVHAVEDFDKAHASSLKGILKNKAPAHSVRFADEVTSENSGVMCEPCLTQVFEYSKYETHNYVNIDDLDLGYDDLPDTFFNDDDANEVYVDDDVDVVVGDNDGKCQNSYHTPHPPPSSKLPVYNVDTDEIYLETVREDRVLDRRTSPNGFPTAPLSTMVPYRTYQTHSASDGVVGATKASSSDDNSDTGLSSMHSDELLPAILETLV